MLFCDEIAVFLAKNGNFITIFFGGGQKYCPKSYHCPSPAHYLTNPTKSTLHFPHCNSFRSYVGAWYVPLRFIL
jgi:hypothetical protein